MAPSQDRTRCVHGGPSHRNVPAVGPSTQAPRGGAGSRCTRALWVSPRLPHAYIPAPGTQACPQPARLECLNNQMPTTNGTGTWAPLTLTSCPLHTCRADSPVMPSLETVPSSPEPRNLPLCLVKGTLGLLWTMGPGQLNKGEGASYRESAADPLLGAHLGTSHGQSIAHYPGALVLSSPPSQPAPRDQARSQCKLFFEAKS